MAKSARGGSSGKSKSEIATAPRKSGETHQVASGGDVLTTNQGTPISDNQNSLKAGARGPTLLEDFVLREKITHFDHERIPERIVHARGSGAHGVFQPTKSMRHLTKANFLSDPKKKTEVFVRFSTVAGGAGSVDLPRDVRGFAVKFYTEEGNFDLVGNNIPIFFIQDAMKFPDLVHSVKMEADRGYPQAASAHDTFWDFISLMPEALHMVTWAMSDRAIPRALRFMEGFGIHTFRFVNEEGKSTFVKFHWRPVQGSSSVIWDEAVKISGADPDFHRRDLYESIEKGDYPQWDFAVQAFDQRTADKLPFDILDATKLIPEETVPLEVIGRLTLNRNPDNFFAETEQVAFHPGHVVPGIDFTDDPLLQGRLFSYTDTQLSRLGGPNFHELPINRPRCPMHNFQRDGIHRMDVPKGRANYEPNSIEPGSPRESPDQGFATFPKADIGDKLRQRSETFADHYSQARLFFRSQSESEQNHIIGAFTFELGKVDIEAIRKRMLGHLMLIDKDLGNAVAEKLAMEGEADAITPARKPVDLPASDALSIHKKWKPTLNGRKVGVLVTDGADGAVVSQLVTAIEKEGAVAQIVAPKAGGVTLKGGKTLAVDQALRGAPSVVFDHVAIVASAEGAATLAKQVDPVNWVRDAFGHLKVIGHTPEAKPLLQKAAIEMDAGVVDVQSNAAKFIATAKQGRLWDREPKIRD
jgi:catalase